MRAVAQLPQPFPVAEGIGIFIGIVAWDVLSAGEMELLKASLIAAVCCAGLVRRTLLAEQATGDTETSMTVSANGLTLPDARRQDGLSIPRISGAGFFSSTESQSGRPGGSSR
jgi:hypothetical protein